MLFYRDLAIFEQASPSRGNRTPLDMHNSQDEKLNVLEGTYYFQVSEDEYHISVDTIKFYRFEGKEYKTPSLGIINRTIETDYKYKKDTYETITEIYRLFRVNAIRSFL